MRVLGAIACAVATLLWANLLNPYVWVALGVTVAFGAVGFADDYLKVRRGRNLGLTARAKFGLQVLAAAIAAAALLGLAEPYDFRPTVAFPFLKQAVVSLGLAYVPFVVLVLVGASNAVNLTDGLDGLATVPVIIVALSFGFISYLVGNSFFADYLAIHYVPGTGELAVLCGAVIGAAFDAIMAALPDWSIVCPAGGWSLLVETDDPARTSADLLAAGVAATPMTGWGDAVAARYVRFVFSAEPTHRLATLSSRLKKHERV